MLNPLSMLFGAALVALGVLASAFADRIRGLRISRDAVPRAHRASPVPVPQVVEVPRATVPKPPREPKAADDGSDDVIAALVAAGYKKQIATEATWACNLAERATIETWMAAALRRSARGGMA